MADDSLPETKVCTKCGDEKELCDFYTSPDGAYGRRARCKSCERTRSKNWKKANPEAIARQRMAYRDKNNEISARRNRERPDYHKQWRDQNRDRLRENQKRANARIRSKIERRLSDAVAANINGAIRKGSRRGRKTFEMLGFTVEQLMAHLELQFHDGMSWDNYGREGWHIDHRVPISVHNFKSPDHTDFKRAWALSNLQPMWAGKNISKGNRLDGPFQPSLAF